jgi:hypothetical protein
MALVLTAVLAMAAAPAALAAEGDSTPPAAAAKAPAPGAVVPADPAPATDKKPAPEKAEKADPMVQELRSAENPHVAKVEQKARELIAPLSQGQMKDLFLLREGYGLIRSVEIVQRDIGRAVRLCGEDNPDLKEPMAARFRKWTDTVSPVLKDKMSTLQKAIDTQSFAKPDKIRGYFKALDDAATYAEKKFDKRVVTTPDACKSLLQSMNGTEKEISGIMSDLEVPQFSPAPAHDGAADKGPEKKAD